MFYQTNRYSWKKSRVALRKKNASSVPESLLQQLIG